MMNSSMTNDSLACEEERYIGKTSIDPDTEFILRYLLIGSLILIFPFNLIPNVFLLILTVTVKSLHQTIYFLTLQVVIIDILLTIVTSPIIMISAFVGQWIMGAEFCSVSTFFVHIMRHSRYWLMFVFVIDQFATVFFAFSYTKYQSKLVSSLSVMAWSVSFVIAILPIVLDCEEFSRLSFYCSGGNGCTDRYLCQSSRIVTITLTNVMGSFLPLVLYTMLFIKAKKLQNKQITIRPDATKKHRNNLRVNITFLYLFFSLFGVTIFPFLFSIVGISISNVLGIHPPPGFYISTFVFRLLYNLLPIFDALAIMRNTDYRLAAKMFKAQLFKTSKQPTIQSPLSRSK